MNLVTVDVSKNKLDVLFDDSGDYEIIENNKKSINKLINKISKLDNPKLVFEASGGYDKILRNTALDKGISCSICNGRRVREFARSQGKLAKTDKIDTTIIAQYAKKTDLQVINSREPEIESLRAFSTRRKQVLDLINQEENKLEHNYPQAVLRSIKESVRYLKKQLKKLDLEIDTLIENNPKLKAKKNLLETIPGFGKIVSITLIADLPELGTLSKSKISCLAGLAPMNNDSGKFKGQRRIKHSRGQIKIILFMAVLSAIKHNPKTKEFYSHLKNKGKKTKVAMVACMRKLIIYANAMLKENKEFKT